MNVYLGRELGLFFFQGQGCFLNDTSSPRRDQNHGSDIAFKEDDEAMK